jgi:hypothetical protein
VISFIHVGGKKKTNKQEKKNHKKNPKPCKFTLNPYFGIEIEILSITLNSKY